MISRESAVSAMINVSLGVATDEERLLVETMDERLFSDIYSELESGKFDSNYSIEDYYETEEDKEDKSKSQWDLDSDDDEIESEFEEFMREFGSSYETEKDARKDFLENYCSKTSDRNYSDDIDYELESLIVDEFSDFLISNSGNYEDSDEAYDDYIRNHCSYL
jgi:hypothetical protein